MTGTPVAGEEVAVMRNLGLTITYKAGNGSSLNPLKIKQGTDFTANISVANPGILGFYRNLALNQIFPSGWEIRNDRLFDELNEYTEQRGYTYQDVRDDRVYTFFDLPTGKRFTLSVMLNAAYAGKFYLPGVVAEAMYDNNVFASSKGQWVEVVQE